MLLSPAGPDDLQRFQELDDAVLIAAVQRLEGEPGLSDVSNHEATKDIPKTLPRTPSHGKEWLDACRGEGQVKTFSDFDIGGKLTEIGLAGVVGIRTGRANPGLLNRITVDYYGTQTQLQQIAGFSVPEARLLVIQPYDKTAIPAIERAIQEAPGSAAADAARELIEEVGCPIGGCVAIKGDSGTIQAEKSRKINGREK